MALKLSYRPLTELVPYAANSRTHSEAQVAQIAASIREWGFTNPILIDESGGVIAGHGRLLAARQLGMSDVPTITLAGLTDAQRKAYVIADNKLAMNAGWDEAMLAAELEDLRAADFDLAMLGFADGELADLLADRTDGLTDEDDVPDVGPDPVAQTGDVWLLGRHRLVCGDCMDAANWDRLEIEKGYICFTSPPYNAGESSGLRDKYIPGNKKTRKFYDVYEDNKSSEEYKQLLDDVAGVAFGFVDALAINVQLLGGCKKPLLSWIDGVSDSIVDVITWDKKTSAPHIQPGVMSSRFEWILILSSNRPSTKVVPYSSWQGKYSNVYVAPSNSGNQFASTHGATFPVHLPEFILGDLMNRARGVVDCFCGTGTSIIAAEKLGKRGVGIELSPAYIDVAIKRWQDFTGQDAVLESSGMTFRELSNARTQTGADTLKDAEGYSTALPN